jgi:Protein of unknown function (DUF4058)
MSKRFPGMDPYLENPACWRDFHHEFIGAWRSAIAELLPEPYDARLDETVQVVPMSEEVIQLIYPDVALSRARKRRRSSRDRNGGTALLEPVVIPHELVEEVRQARIEIFHRPERSLVTVIEMLSPTNKVGDGYFEFCAKRLSILRQRVHLVELDLLIGGRRLPLSEALPPGDYYAMVSRSDKRPDCEVYAWNLRDPLPAVPIPLRNPDPDVHIDLGAVFEAAYTRGRYGRILPYGKPPQAPLKKADKQWAAERSRGK